MFFCKEITDADIGGTANLKGPYKVRRAARGVLVRDDGKVALIYASKWGYYKLPGGGIDKGETIEEALMREIEEETGCKSMNIVDDLGMVLEYKNKQGKLQINYCFAMQTHETKFSPQFTEKEKAQGFQLEWKFPEEALTLIKTAKTDNCNEKFKLLRDVYLMEKYVHNISDL